MGEIEVKDLKEGDKVIVDDEVCVIKKLEFSNIGKHGKSKCRIEALSDSGEEKIIIRIAEDTIDTP